MDYKKEDNDKYYFGMSKILRLIICSACLLVIGISIFRIISTGTPRELRNYLIKSPEINEAYIKYKNDLTVYEIDVRRAFGEDAQETKDDSFFIEHVYYLEDIKNLQITFRIKNSQVQKYILNSESPFIAFMSVTGRTETPGWSIEREMEEGIANKYIWDYFNSFPVNEEIFGKNTDKYQYIVYSFDDVEIDYLGTIIQLELFINDKDSEKENIFENGAFARFVIFDGINMEGFTTPKNKIPVKNFKFD